MTGFALMGHLLEMAQGGDLQAEVEVSAVDLIPEALEFARMVCSRRGCTATVPLPSNGWMPDRRRSPYRISCMIRRPPAGLLIAVDPADADALLAS